jgi:ubiquinone/menaquinone biosynthesis C-methylase UbiE
MTSHTDDPVAIQRHYYTKTAADYDTMHAGEGDADENILQTVSVLLQMVEPCTLLDVGCGTGRGIQYFREKFPLLSAYGVEPVRALLEQAVEKSKVPPGIILQGSGYALPFADASIDVVCSFAILHHVREPNRVVREMMRVAKKAVLIVDSNRFGQGRFPIRAIKLALYKTGLWPAINYIKTRGKGYMITEGDGLAYSYSVYDSFDCLANGAAHLLMLPAEAGLARSWFHPLLTSSGVIAFAIKGTD